MDFEFVLIAIVILVFIVAFIWQVFYSLNARIKRKLKKAPLKKISQFKDGDVAKIIGKIEAAGEILNAPLTGRKCTYFHIIIEQYKSSGKSGHWKTIIEEVRSTKFVVRDSLECAFIGSKNVKAHIVKDGKFSSGFMENASAKLENYLNQHGKSSENWLGFNKRIRYKEGILEPDEEVSVYGQGNWRDATTLGLPEKYHRVLEISDGVDDPIYLSDDPDTVIKPKPTYAY